MFGDCECGEDLVWRMIVKRYRTIQLLALLAIASTMSTHVMSQRPVTVDDESLSDVRGGSIHYCVGSAISPASEQCNACMPNGNQQYVYNIKMEVMRDGQLVSQTRRAIITPGQAVQVDFNAGALSTASR